MFKSLFGARTQSTIKNIRPREVQEMLHSQDSITIIDVRTATEFNNGHIPQARLIPLQVITRRMSEIPRDQPVILTCASGNRSRVAGEQLAAEGFQNLYNMQGGLFAWQRAGLAIR